MKRLCITVALTAIAVLPAAARMMAPPEHGFFGPADAFFTGLMAGLTGLLALSIGL